MAYTKTNWQDLPNTTTPITATRLNNMESGIENNDKRLNGTIPAGEMIVDSIRSKNMFNKNSMVYSDRGFLPFDTSSTKIGDYGGSGTYILLIKLVEGKTYTISKMAAGRFRAGFTNTPTPALNVDGVITSRTSNNDTGTSITFTVPTGSPYFVCNFYSSDQTADVNAGYSNILNSIQIEEGSQATPYMPYQNLDGMETYSTEEQVIGTWLGKPLYRKVAHYTSTISVGWNGVAFNTLGLSNISYLRVVSALGKSGDTYEELTSHENRVLINKGNNTLSLYSTDTAFSEVIFILEYTKTTD